MHFELLVEGQGELTTLSILMSRIVGNYGAPHTWRIHKHRGIGCLPLDPVSAPNRRDQSLLHNLPSKLRAYGNGQRDDLTVVVLVDLDDRPDCSSFKSELMSTLESCPLRPRTLFRIAIEELEAWFLGDRNALRLAFPDARLDLLDDYQQDSQCGTWEKLADIVHPGGYNALVSRGKRSPIVMQQKRKWAAAVANFMDVNANASASFCAFRDGLINCC